MPIFIPNIAWPESATEAVPIQQELRGKVRLKNSFENLKIITGIDVGHDKSETSHAAIVLMDLATLMPIESVRISMPTSFAYIPGLLSFREIPAILAALSKLKNTPDILMVDGQGIAHPRRLGIAAHLGALADMPALGVAKSRLTGTYKTLGDKKGMHVQLMSGKEHIGIALRSKEKCLPLFISAGHKIDQETALSLTLRCLTRYRLPEPTRLADKLSK